MSNEAILLHRALQNVAQELERLGKLINADAGALPKDLQADAEMISILFKNKWEELDYECRSISEKVSPSNAGSRGISEEISQRNAGSRGISALWARYTGLRYEGLPKLTGELLAVIGGIHLRQVKLDTLGSPNVSFTEVAQQLVNDLNQRSNYRMRSLLIVAEERYEPSHALILRLRFPACDVWHLSFTAYEHGYHSARDQEFKAVTELRDSVRKGVEPFEYVRYGPPKDKSCYLPEVLAYWDDFKREFDEIREPEEEKAYREARKPEIEALQHRQDVHVCRLLADVFATFYVGPAYTYALLHLSSEPIKLAQSGDSAAGACVDLNKPISPWMPPFLQRLVVSLETLGWMHVDAINRTGKGFDESLFDKDPVQASGILGAYYQTCMAINGLTSPERLQKCYEDTKKALRPWLDQFKEIIHLKARTAGETLDNWEKAQELLPYLTGEKALDSLENDDFSLWAIVNAAWHARHQTEIPPRPSMEAVSPTNVIEGRAMDLIDRKLNPKAGKGAQTGQSPGVTAMGTSQAQPEIQFRRELAFIKLEAESAGNQDVIDVVDAMIRSGSYRQSQALEQFVQQSPNLGGKPTLDRLALLSRKPQP